MNNNLTLFDDFHDLFFPRFWKFNHLNSCGPKHCGPRRFFHNWDRGYPMIENKESEYLLSLDVPGVSKEDLKIEVTDGVLSVYTDYKNKEDRAEEQRHYRFSFTIPEDVEKEKMDVSLNQGIVKITMPKKESSKPLQLEIKETE